MNPSRNHVTSVAEQTGAKATLKARARVSVRCRINKGGFTRFVGFYMDLHLGCVFRG